MSKLKEFFEPKCKHRHTARTHPHCFKDGKAIELQTSKPENVLILDVETLPLVGYAFNPWKTDITLAHIIKDFCILSYSAKWLGDDKVISEVLTPKEVLARDDSRILQNAWKLMETANVVVTHNGKRFDIKKLYARFWKHKIKKPSSFKLIDTLVSAKATFGLTYNSVSAIAKFIEAEEKLDTDFSLWVKCDSGDQQSLQYMREYNEQDVETQEEIYLSMRGWIENHPDLSLYTGQKNVCPVCLSSNHQEIGTYVGRGKLYREHRCDSCNAIWHDSNCIKEKNEG